MSVTLRPLPVESADDARRVIVGLCQRFYDRGWVSGTGGGMSIRLGDKVYMAPSGIAKEMIEPDWIFELDLDGKTLRGPPAHLGFTVSQCCPLFLEAMKLRGAGAVIHSHSKNAVLAAAIAERDGDSHIELTRLEMLKGLKGVGYADVHRVPVIANTAHECDLADSLRAAILDNPLVHAVVVQRHGMYVWGDDWLAAKRHAESYDELFAQAGGFDRLGLPLRDDDAGAVDDDGDDHSDDHSDNDPFGTGDHVTCSFCAKRRSEVKKLIAGPAVFICDQCICLCNDIIADEAAAASEAGTVDDA